MAIIYHVQAPGVYVAFGLSTDTKPSSPPDNCMFFETDTGGVLKSSASAWIFQGNNSNTPSLDLYISAGITNYYSGQYEIPDGKVVDLSDGSTIEIG